MNTSGSYAGLGGGRKMKSKPKTKMGKREKVADVMHEFKTGKLRSGSRSGPRVTKPKQAVAIAMREAGVPRKKRGR